MKRTLPGFRLTLGITLIYLGVLLVIPLAACVAESRAVGTGRVLGRRVDAASHAAAYLLTFGASLFGGGPNVAVGSFDRLGVGALRVAAEASCRFAGRSAAGAADCGGRTGVFGAVRRQTAGSASSWCRWEFTARIRGWALCSC